MMNRPHKMILAILKVILLCSSPKVVQTQEYFFRADVVGDYVVGDYVVGGLYPIRPCDYIMNGIAGSVQCKDDIIPVQVILTEAHLYFLEKVSQSLQASLGFSLGSLLMDSCSSSSVSLDRSFQFLKHKNTSFCDDTVVHDFRSSVPIVISSDVCDIAMYVNRMLEKHCVPFFSVLATSSFFSSRKLHPFFLRTVPSAENQAMAIIALLKRMKWNHVGIVYEDSSYSRSLLSDFQSQLNDCHVEIEKAQQSLIHTGKFSLEKFTVCIGWTFRIESPLQTTWTCLHNYLNMKKAPKVIIVLTGGQNTELLLNNIAALNLDYTPQLLSVDGWTSLIYGSQNTSKLMDHTIGTEPGIRKNPDAEFGDYLKGLTFDKAKSPWLKQLIKEQNNCSDLTDSKKDPSSCQGKTLKLLVEDVALRYADRIRIAFNILKSTLRQFHSKRCLTKGLCDAMRKVNGFELMDKLLSHNDFLPGKNGAPPNYQFYYYSKENKTWTNIGSYSYGSIDFEADELDRRLGPRKHMLQMNIERCFSNCSQGYPKRSWMGNCCWECQNCPEGHIVKSNKSSPYCSRCPPPTRPSRDLRKCIDAKVSRIEGIWPVSFTCSISGVGTVTSIFAALLMYAARKSVILKAAGIQSSILLLVSNILVFLSALLPAAIHFCPERRSGILAGLLMATSLTFNRTLFMMKSFFLHQTGKDANCNSAKFWEKLVTTFSTSLQVPLTIMWLILWTPKTEYLDFDGRYYSLCSCIAHGHLSMILLQPLMATLLTITVLFYFQRQIDTKFRWLQHCCFIVTLVVSAVLIVADILILCVAAHADEPQLHMKLGLFFPTIAIIGWTSMAPILQPLMSALSNDEESAAAIISKKLHDPVDLLSKYRIERRDLVINEEEGLGSGYFAQVFKGQLLDSNHKHTDTVAIKRMKRNNGEAEHTKFYEEAFIMSQLSHDNIVQFVGVCQTSSDHLLVLEFLGGGSLEDALRKRGDTFIESQLIGFCYDISKALQYMEGKELIHRDIKADNCLLKCNHGQETRQVAKLSDFGLAKDISDDSSYSCKFGFVAPLRHTAPEGLTINKFTTKSDVWSYGVLVWQIFDRALTPFHFANDRDVMRIIRCGKTVLDFEGQPSVPIPTALGDLLKKCLQYQPHQRPSFAVVSKLISEMIGTDYGEALSIVPLSKSGSTSLNANDLDIPSTSEKGVKLESIYEKHVD